MSSIRVTANGLSNLVLSDRFLRPSGLPRLNFPTIMLEDKTSLQREIDKKNLTHDSIYGWWDWIALKKSVSLPIESDFYCRDDLDPDLWCADIDRLGDEILYCVNQRGLRGVADAILQDFSVFMMLPAKSNEANSIFYELLCAYQQGYLPCGWSGDFPVGALVLFRDTQ